MFYNGNSQQRFCFKGAFIPNFYFVIYLILPNMNERLEVLVFPAGNRLLQPPARVSTPHHPPYFTFSDRGGAVLPFSHDLNLRPSKSLLLLLLHLLHGPLPPLLQE